MRGNRKNKKLEKAQVGGYSSGRNFDAPIKREGRLSDILGNSGVLAKHA